MADLMTTSISLLSQVLVLTENRHRLGSFGCEVPWLVSLLLLLPQSSLRKYLISQRLHSMVFLQRGFLP